MDQKLDELSKVYHYLHDDRSRQIFISRLLYCVTGDKRYIDKMIREEVPEFGSDGIYDPEMKEGKLLQLNQRVGFKRVIIYGAGYIGEKLLSLFETGKVIAFCDKKAEQGEFLFGGLPVIPISQTLDYKDVVYLLGSWRYRNEMREALIQAGVPETAILLMPSDLILNCSLSQYFDSDIITLTDHEVFVDCGAFQLETTMEFIKRSRFHYSYIYAFEPDPRNYSIIQQNIINNDISKIETLPCGVWDETTMLHFSSDEDSSSFSDAGDLQIAVTSIDEVLKGKKATFIKMDVEGSELRALIGAEATIKQYRPKLAISLYHKREDLIEIPTYIKSIVPEYKLYIRHYSNYFVETVLYAVIE